MNTEYDAASLIADRFWSYFNKNGPIVNPELGNCWIWTKSKFKTGYGQFWLPGVSKVCKVHRISYLLTHGYYPINEGSHLCDTRDCGRPSHIVDETHQENGARIKYTINPICRRGHNKNGLPYCRTCMTNLQREARARKRTIVLEV